MTKTRPFLSTCYGYPSTTEVPPCCQAATKKLTFSTTSVLLLLNVPLSLSRATIFRRQKNPRRVYRPKIAGILFVSNEPEGKYYTVPWGHHGRTRGTDGDIERACVVRYFRQKHDGRNHYETNDLCKSCNSMIVLFAHFILIIKHTGSGFCISTVVMN